MRASRQLSFHLPEWGGLRKGAGRKPSGPRPLVSHTKRKSLDERHPVHVTMRALPEIPSLRAMGRAVKQALFAGANKEDGSFRLIHFSIQSNHLHLIVEASSTKGLSLGIQGLAIRVAWAVNRAIGRKRGKVFSDRYHDHHLATPSEVHACLVYVINNHRKHLAEQGRFLARSYRDPHSSAPYLHQRGDDCPLPRPQTWFLRGGYLKAGGEIDLSRVPGQRPRAAQRSSQRAFGRA